MGNGTVSWKLKYIGKAVKAGIGEKFKASFVIESEEETSVEVRLVEKNASFKVDAPSRLDLKKGLNELYVNVEIPEKTVFKPLWIAVISVQDNEKSENAYLGILPVSEKSSRKVIKEAVEDDKSYSVGALGFTRKDFFYLSYRWRNGNKARGEKLEIAKSSDGLNYETVKTFNKNDYGYLSFEQSDLTTTPEGGFVFLYSADIERLWKIFKVEANEVSDIELPGEPLVDKAKDPSILYDAASERYIIVYSDCSKPGHDLAVVSTKDFKQLEVLAESIAYTQFTKQGNEWSRTHIHAGSLLFDGKYYVLFYDALPKQPSCFGSGWLGVAISKDLKKWIDLTPDKPLWKGNGVDYTFRYVAVYCDEKQYFLYAEEETSPRGKKDTVVYYSKT